MLYLEVELALRRLGGSFQTIPFGVEELTVIGTGDAVCFDPAVEH
jgi:hypothetical protein